jgi:hypothetical protein
MWASLLLPGTVESRSSRILEEERVRTDLVRLIPFYVQVAMTPASSVNIYALTDIITDRMNDSFDMKSRSQGCLRNNMTSFESVVLEWNTTTQEASISGDIGLLCTARFTSVSV